MPGTVLHTTVNRIDAMAPQAILEWVASLGSAARRVAVPPHTKEAVASGDPAPFGIYTAAFGIPLAPGAPPDGRPRTGPAPFSRTCRTGCGPSSSWGGASRGLRLRPPDEADQVLGWELERAGTVPDAAQGPDMCCCRRPGRPC